MPIGEIDPVIYGSLPGYIISGYQTSSTTLSSGGVNAGDAQEFYIIEQGLDIDYVRKRDFNSYASETSSYSLSGAATLSINQPFPQNGTHLYCRVKAYARGQRVFANFSGSYSQPQLFAVYPNQSDAFGQSYGPVSAGSGTLSSIKLGPGGIIRTIQPGYQRHPWSSVSANVSAFPASGFNQTLEAYNFAVHMGDAYPSIASIASSFSSINPGNIVVNVHTGPPTWGRQYRNEATYLYDLMYTRYPTIGLDSYFTWNKMSPSYVISYSWMQGNYNTSSEPNISARMLIADVANTITTPYTTATTGVFAALRGLCNLFNTSLYWNPDVQLNFGVPSLIYDNRAFAAPVLSQYRLWLHST